MIKRLFVTGYRSYELEIFSDEDDKYFFITEFLKTKLKQYIDQGLEWIVISGQLGVELWTADIAMLLKHDYPHIKIGILLPYQTYGDQWNEYHQHYLQKVLQGADYVNYTSQKPYQNGGQLSGNTSVILGHTDGALLIYDTSKEGKSEYVLEQIQQYRQMHDYYLEQVAFDELEQFVVDYQEMNKM